MDYTVLKHFTGSDGGNPWAGLTLSGSTLYGTTYSGGSSGWGTVFKINTDGAGFKVLKNFALSDGGNPWAGLTLSGSTLYGTASRGGDFDYGTVFKINLSIPLVIEPLGDAVVLSWSDPAFALQAAPTVTGGYTNVPGATSPYTNAIPGDQMFFRLIGN